MMRSAWYARFFACLLLPAIGGAADPQQVEVRPRRIDDALTNPNMGLADFHMGWHCEAPDMTAEQCADMRDHQWPKNHPATAVAYFRWHWDRLGSRSTESRRPTTCSLTSGTAF